MTDELNILSPEESIALKASAGSGKTFSLSLRVVNLLLEGVEPDRILCLTFTNKATNEMYERIVRTITRLAAGPPGDGDPDHEALTLAAYRLQRRESEEDLAGALSHVRDRARSVHEAVVREISRLRVSTIDSFFNSILRLFPFEAGVMPDFRIMTESEEEAIYGSAYDEFAAGLHADASTRELLKRLVLLSGSSELSPFRLLSGCFREMLSVRTEIEGLWETESVRRADVAVLLDECSRLSRLEERVKGAAASLAGKMSGTYPELGTAAAAEVRRYREASVRELPALTSLAKDRYTDYRYFSSLEYSPEVQDAFELLKQELRDYFIRRNRLFQSITLHLFMKFLQYPDGTKQRLNALSFNDVTRLCYNLLIRNALLDESPDYFYFRLDSRIEHLLIDEFQDTSVVQWRILKPIADELTSGLGQKEKPGSFFYVGDPKQSIYRFRGGEGRLFDAVLSSYPEKLKARSLRKNFRSGKAIVEFVNRVFSGISSAYGYEYEVQESTLERQGFVDVRFIEREKGKTSAGGHVAEPKIQMVLSFVQDLVQRGVPPGDIAVLCQKNRTCEEYAAALRGHGYDVLTESAESILEQPSVRAVMNLLRWLEDPLQVVCLFGFLFSVEGLLDAGTLRRLFNRTLPWSSPAAIPPEVSERLSRLQRVSGLIPVWSLIERIISEFGLHRAFDCDPNLLYLMGMAASEEISDPLSIGGFVTFMESRSSTRALIEAGVSEKSVRLLTVHKAKGLEFPYVILPELEIKMTFDARSTPVIIDQGEDMEVRGLYVSENKHTASLVPEFGDVRIREEERIRTDRLNYLYVALTRARDGLMVVAEKPERPDVRLLSDVLFISMGGDPQGYRSGALPDAAPSAAAEASPRLRSNPFAVLTHSMKDALDLEPSRGDTPLLEAEAGVVGADEYRDRLFGEAFHYAVEMLEDFSADSVQRATGKVRQRYTSLAGHAVASIERRLSALVTDDTFLRLVGGDVRCREVSFARAGGVYRVDLLVFDGTAARVLDFKTGLDVSLVDEYMRQVGDYVQVVGECYGGVVSKVEGYLVLAGEEGVDVREVRLP
ncbi:MAG: UvrD-helicase domain-containing protein [Nitrospirae bacterium]|nr:UvrD-helicase domain-containing protein [Nitrospirota bacterium]